ncbi:hypothetical protein [Sinorhizobium fredii]|nr:hypothetical protein [Sinorhizobium fredii]
MAMNFTDLTVALSSIAAIGTAAYGLVDTSKVFRGGISNVGFGFIEDALQPFKSALAFVNETEPFELAKANWLNGIDKADQKATVKGLIRLGMTSDTAETLAEATKIVEPQELKAVAAKVEKVEALSEAELALLARFDAVVDARMDAAFERADQKYRNSARGAAAVAAIVLAEIGAWTYYEKFDQSVFLIGLAVGLIAVPMAPIAKDLTSAISTSVAAFKAIRR